MYHEQSARFISDPTPSEGGFVWGRSCERALLNVKCPTPGPPSLLFLGFRVPQNAPPSLAVKAGALGDELDAREVP